MKTHINLLPYRYQLWLLVCQRLRQWSLVWALTLVAVLVHGGMLWSHHDSRASWLASLEREYEPVKKLQTAVKSQQRSLAALKHREALVLELAEQRPVLTVIGCVSRAAKECGGGVTIRSLALQQASDTQATADNVLTLQGIGRDNLAVARFSAALRASQVFRQVQLKTSGEEAINEQIVRSYRLECTF